MKNELRLSLISRDDTTIFLTFPTILMVEKDLTCLGDGIVGGRDLVLSKLFDKDRDGKLNAQERENAEKAIREGLESNFFWNVEKSGPNRPYRLIQKRGQFIDAEDYLPVTSTYPKHPMSLKEATFRTQKDFKESIKKKNR